MKKILLPLFAFAALSVTAQKASNKISFNKGQTIEVTTNMNITTQSMMGEMPVTVVSVEQYVVGEVGPDGIQLTKVPKRMQANISAMGQEMKLDSDNPKDMEGQFGQPIKEMMKQRYEFTIDPAGNVLSVKTGAAKKKEEDGGMAGMMMPGMNAASGVPVVGQASFFKVLPAREVAKGDTWTDSVNTEGNRTTTVYTVKDVTDTEVLLDFTGTGKTKTTQSMMGQSVDINVTGKNSGSVVLDKATGLLKQKSMNGDTENTMNLQGQEMNTSTKSTIVITAKTL